MQDGPAVFKAAVVGMADVTAEVLKRNERGCSVTSPGWSRIKPTGASSRRWPSAWGSGSIASSSISIATGIPWAGRFPLPSPSGTSNGRFSHGDRLVLSAFGAGFTAGSVYLRWAIV